MKADEIEHFILIRGIKHLLIHKNDLRNCHNYLLVRDIKKVTTTFKTSQSVTAKVVKQEENLHCFLPLLQEKMC